MCAQFEGEEEEEEKVVSTKKRTPAAEPTEAPVAKKVKKAAVEAKAASPAQSPLATSNAAAAKAAAKAAVKAAAALSEPVAAAPTPAAAAPEQPTPAAAAVSAPELPNPEAWKAPAEALQQIVASPYMQVCIAHCCERFQVLHALLCCSPLMPCLHAGTTAVPGHTPTCGCSSLHDKPRGGCQATLRQGIRCCGSRGHEALC